MPLHRPGDFKPHIFGEVARIKQKKAPHASPTEVSLGGRARANNQFANKIVKLPVFSSIGETYD